MQLVKLVNKGKTDFVVAYNGDNITVKKGGDAVVPFEAAASRFGDPRVRNDGRNKARDILYQQTRAGMNFYNGFTTEKEWEDDLKPKIETYDLTSGQRIFMLFEDPTGELLGDVTLVEQDTQTEIAMLQERLQRLEALLEQQRLPTPSEPPEPATVPAAKSADIPKPKATKAAQDAPGAIRNDD